MNIKKTTLCTAMGLAMGGVAMSAQADLSASATLSFDAGAPVTTSCLLGTTPPCDNPLFDITDMGGSYFNMAQGNGNADKVAMSQFAPLNIGSTQTSSGQHTGGINGSESPSIDNAWNFFYNTGMHTLTSAITVISDFGSIKTLDFSGWGVNWGNFGPGGVSGPPIDMGGVATIVCSTSSCSDSSTYVLDMDVHVPVAFASVPYSLHLEGHVTSSAIPVPAAVWLFGSGLLGLAGVARRRKSS